MDQFYGNTLYLFSEIEDLNSTWNCGGTAALFVGMQHDGSLTWKNYIAHANTKMSSAIFAIKQVKKFLPYSGVLV